MDPLALPDHAILAAYAEAFDDGGHWAVVVDPSYKVLFVSEELRKLYGPIPPIGSNYFSSEFLEYLYGSAFVRVEEGQSFTLAAPAMVYGDPEGRDGVKRVVDPQFHEILDQTEAKQPPPIQTSRFEVASLGITTAGTGLNLRIDGGAGTWIGTALIAKPAAGMAQLTAAHQLASGNASPQGYP